MSDALQEAADQLHNAFPVGPVPISRDVAEFLLGVVYSIPLSAGQPNFDETLRLVVKARDELRAAVESPGA